MQPDLPRRADFSRLRYAQCWEDADILLEALDVRPGDRCLSVASAGDNTLALLSRGPEKVLAVDLSPAQIASLELRVAAYRVLAHGQLLELMGVRPSRRRPDLYGRCRSLLSPQARRFWDGQPATIAHGLGTGGKFEHYLDLFRRLVLPLAHPRARIERLLRGGPSGQREAFYAGEWDTWRWRLLFRVFFSRLVLGRAGRDPSFFLYVNGGVAGRLLARSRHALTELDPSQNAYVHWILTGTYGVALPFALRMENFDAIRAHLDRLEWRCASLEEVADRLEEGEIDRYNLSDVFEYVSLEHYHRLLERLARAGRSGGRMAYWNLFADRHRPDYLADQLRPLKALADRLHAVDKTFFYGAFVVEEIV